MTKTTFFERSSDYSVPCPNCHRGHLSYRDSCERILLLEGRQRFTCIIRRLKCEECGKLHRELPDILAPYKHYAAEVISGVLDGIITPDDLDSEVYPCEDTMVRWHHWMMANELRIDGYLKSTGSRLPGFSDELLKSDRPLLQELRSSSAGWLETILRFIYNAGGFLVPFRQ